MFCKACGKKIPEDSNFCLYCGASVADTGVNNIAGKGKALISIRHEKSFGWGLYKIKIFVDGNFIQDIKSGKTASFEVENGKHIIYCSASFCDRSEPVEIRADSNEIHFSAVFSSAFSMNGGYRVILTKTRETEKGTWE
jgi:hypothetical protein